MALAATARRLWTRLHIVARLLLIGLATYAATYVYDRITLARDGRHSRLAVVLPSSHVDLYERLDLTRAQCRATFPYLTKDIDDQVKLGPFPLAQIKGDGSPLQIRIRDGRIFVLHAEAPNILPLELLQARTSTLHQLNRALVSSPELFQNSTIISINVHDQAVGTAWSYSRPAFPPPLGGGIGPPLVRAFLMPHFSFWTWPIPWVGSFARAREAIDEIERENSFAEKDARPVWRGSSKYQGGHYPHLREDLLKVAGNQAWTDVQELTSTPPSAENQPTNHGMPPSTDKTGYEAQTNGLMIEDFCRYKYIINTEGITYSGRLQFHQLCNSVILTPAIAHLQHATHHLVKPFFSTDLPIGNGAYAQRSRWKPLAEVQRAWPERCKPEEANMVFVASDWSDLKEVVEWLEDNPRVAEGIARRQRETFAGKGYLSPAAEVCYWRELVRGWSEVVRLVDDNGKEVDEWTGLEETPMELFVLD